MNAYEDLLQYSWTLDIIDTHEHLPSEHDWMRRNNDVIAEWLGHYFSSDLLSAGLDSKQLDAARGDKMSITEKWDMLAPFWEAARNTGYARALDVTARELYGLRDGITGKTIENLNEQFCYRRQDARKGISYYRHVFKDRCRISVAILNTFDSLDCDRSVFRRVLGIDEFIRPSNHESMQAMANKYGLRVHSLDDWKACAEAAINEAMEKGFVGLKSGAAYFRSLKYNKTPTQRAENEFAAYFNSDCGPSWDRIKFYPASKLQDHMMHFILSVADRKELTFQFHTGLQEGTGNHIANSNPELMTNLFMEYANVKFDLFHLGYPYQNVCGALAKNFRNVYLDMCWGHIISPNASVQSLVEWLDVVPANKIMGFGGDYVFIDGVYGHCAMARQNIARALAIKIEQQGMDIDSAKDILRRLLVGNPTALFKLK